jgi:hypothetical protein
MILIGIETVYTKHTDIKDSPRRRVLENWTLECDQLEDGNKLYYLRGRVVREANGFEPPARFTRTSPIVGTSDNLSGFIMIRTASGSEYTLDKSVQPEENPLDWPTEVLNPWIQGDNWVNAR